MKRLVSVAAGLATAAFSQGAFAFASGPGTCVAEAASITGMQSRPRNDPGIGPFQVMFDMGTTPTRRARCT